jgi:[glutamine synthetase] adenylyltransferase / [glutamine synthetase]-adenylyl-L-tyrosine phosphorylase
MADMEQLARDLLVHHPERWVRHHMASFPADYFRVFDSSEVSRHLEAMLTLTDDRPVHVRAESESGGVWRVDVVGYDAFQFLSTVCTMLAVSGLSILDGRVFTSQPPPPDPLASFSRRIASLKRPARPSAPSGPDRRPRIVDVFRVRPVRAQTVLPDWEKFQDELCDLTRLLRNDKYEEVNHRLIRRFVAAMGPLEGELDRLEPIDLNLDVDGVEAATAVRVRVRDSFGFLSLTASALALCGIRIVQSEIRTIDDQVDDVLWVTDRWGHKITSEPKLRELRMSLLLIEHFSRRLPRATDPEAALVHFSRFATETMARPDWVDEFEALEKPQVLDALVRMLGESHFLWEDYLHAQPENVLHMICDPAEWGRHPGQKQLTADLAAALAGANTSECRGIALRRFRDREIFRADLRSILGLSRGQEEFSAELTAVAEVLLRAAYAQALQEAASRHFQGDMNRIPPSVLCALGKFGGRELGFASDLEVMIVYDDRTRSGAESGNGSGGFFDTAVAALRGILGSREGHAFELDFRLRPYGRAGPPATSITSFLDYYRTGGAAWGYERQALIKLRMIAGDFALGREVEDHRNLFVYGPEPLDLDGLRRMRRLQIEQLVLPGTISAKYSPGALVDVEYVVQALQIVHGSRDASLRSPNTLEALAALGAVNCLDVVKMATLRSSYRYFRLLIDALRVVRDHPKDLTVPAFGTDEYLLLSRRMRATRPESLRSDLELWLQETQSIAEELPSFLVANPANGTHGTGTE